MQDLEAGGLISIKLRFGLERALNQECAARLSSNLTRAGLVVQMVLISVLAHALKTMYNAEKRGKRQVLIRPSSKVVIKFLQVMQKKG